MKNDLIKAIIDNDTIRAKEFIQKRAKKAQFIKSEVFDYQDKFMGFGGDGFTPIMWATLLNNDEIVEMLIEKKVDLNLQNINGDTALMIAIKYNRIKIFEMLIKEKVNLDIQNKYGTTALMYASQYYRTEMAEMLINLGANLDLRHENGNSAFNLADINRHIKIKNLLDKAGAKYFINYKYLKDRTQSHSEIQQNYNDKL